MSIKNVKDIPGVPIRVFPLSEARLRGIFTLTFSDAIELCKKTSLDLPANPEFRNLFLDKLCEHFEKEIEKKNKGNHENSN